MALPVVIVPYDTRWPHLYGREAERIIETASGAIVAIEHIGSTAVPGLSAKPIIDILGGVPGRAAAQKAKTVLEGLGYSARDPVEPDWYFVLSRRDGARGVGYHLHLMTHESRQWSRHLLFRDYLRRHPDAAEEYVRLKTRLAARFGEDRAGYTAAKTSHIRGIEATARRGREQ